MSQGKLTTHVLDTATGKPASAMKITLYRLDGLKRAEITSAVTNSDGRCDGPILVGENMRQGTYELVFEAGDYLRANNAPLTEPAFLDVIPIRFGIGDANSHYHVPLLISPYGYSTYRGS